MGKRSWSM